MRGVNEDSGSASDGAALMTIFIRVTIGEGTLAARLKT